MSDLTSISPFFIVADLQNSVSYYVDKLGFTLQYTGPEENPYFAMVSRGSASLMLKSSGRAMPNYTQYNWARWDAYISITDPDVLYEEYRAAGVVFNQPLRDDADGLWGFEIIDADGYVLFLGRPKN